MRKRTKTSVKKENDRLCAKIIKIRDEGICQKCNKTITSPYDAHWAHVFGRGNHALRWDLLNSLLLCYRCHRWWWHSNPLDAGKWFKEKFPHRYSYLTEPLPPLGKPRNTIIERSIPLTKLLEVNDYLRRKLEEINQ